MSTSPLFGSLRWRFFLVSWPVVLAATLGLALVFDAWAGRRLLELDQEVFDGPGAELPTAIQVAVEAWATGALDPTGLEEAVRAAAATAEIVVVDVDGRVVVTTDSTLALRPGNPAGIDGASREFTRSFTGPEGLEVDRFLVQGSTISGGDGVLGTLFVLPGRPAVPAPDLGEAAGARLRKDARRVVAWATLLTLLLSGLLALTLARPLIRQLEGLVRGAERIRAGDLAARLEPGRPDELGRLERTFNEMALALQRAEAHKRDLVSDAAHELRTPLTNLIGALDAIRDGVKTPDPPTLALLRRQAGILQERVDDLQDLSLAESGQLDLRWESVEVVGLVRDVVVAARAGGACMTIEEPPGDSPPCTVRADTRRLMQVIGNLLRNAVTHTPCDGTVRLDVGVVGDEVVVSVADTGRGIPREHLDRVWSRFYRVESSRDRRQGGSGLGLAIVKQFVESMGGRVAARSQPGEGSVFEVALPRAADPTTGFEATGPAHSPGSSRD